MSLQPAFSARSPNCTQWGKHSKVADFGKKAMPIGALAISLVKQDWLGAILSQVLAEGLYVGNRQLEHRIHKKRPCGCDGAFPSGHMIMYASSASYLHYRYGWQYGLPAYALAIGFSYDRVRHKAHSWWDMLGTAAIVNVIAFIVTPRYTEDVAYLPPLSFLSSDQGIDGPDSSHSSLRKKKTSEKASFMSRVFPFVYTQKGDYRVGFFVQL